MVYLSCTFLLIPPMAKHFGRVNLPMIKSGNLIPHNYLTVILNRNYVKEKLRKQLHEIADDLNDEYSGMKLVYLDANFPFMDNFPLLPHLSHNDGKKVDLSFFYTKDNKITNSKPSNTGYGEFVEPLPNEINQTERCFQRGYWQYDYPKYLTLGSRKGYRLNEELTRYLILKILESKQTEKLFIEPHLKQRLNLINPKVRFQGCRSVRHDDHIHFQIK